MLDSIMNYAAVEKSSCDSNDEIVMVIATEGSSYYENCHFMSRHVTLKSKVKIQIEVECKKRGIDVIWWAESIGEGIIAQSHL